MISTPTLHLQSHTPPRAEFIFRNLLPILVTQTPVARGERVCMCARCLNWRFYRSFHFLSLPPPENEVLIQAYQIAKFSQSQQSITRKRGKKALPFLSKALVHKHTQTNSNREASPRITHLFSPALQLRANVVCVCSLVLCVCVHWYSLCILGLHTCEMSIDADPPCLMAHTNLIFTFSEGNEVLVYAKVSARMPSYCCLLPGHFYAVAKVFWECITIQLIGCTGGSGSNKSLP